MKKMWIIPLSVMLIIGVTIGIVHSQKARKPVSIAAPKLFGSEPLTKINHQDVPNNAMVLSDGSVLISVGQTGNPTEAQTKMESMMKNEKRMPAVPTYACSPFGWAFAMKVNAREQLEWMQVIYPESVRGLYDPQNQGWQTNQLHFATAAPTRDGILFGGTAPVMKPDDSSQLPVLIKYRNNGKKAWEKVYAEFAVADEKFLRSGFMNVGETPQGITAIIFVKKDYFWVKMDANGAILPGSKQPFAFRGSSALEARFAPDGSLYTVDADGGAINVSRHDANTGASLWRKKANDSGSCGLIGTTNIVVTRDGGVAVCGYRESGDTRDVIAARFDANGNRQWVFQYGAPGASHWPRGISIMPSGDIVVASSCDQGNSRYTRLILLNAQGKEVCANNYSGISGNSYFAGNFLIGYGCRRSEDVCVKYIPAICK